MAEFPIIVFSIFVIYSIAVLMMPFVLILMYRRISQAQKTLSAMEHMMRYGK